MEVFDRHFFLSSIATTCSSAGDPSQHIHMLLKTLSKSGTLRKQGLQSERKGGSPIQVFKATSNEATVKRVLETQFLLLYKDVNLHKKVNVNMLNIKRSAVLVCPIIGINTSV